MMEQDKQELRAVVMEVVGAAFQAFESRLDHRLKDMHQQIVSLQADTSLCLDQFDVLGIDMKDVKRELERLADKTAGLSVDMQDVKRHAAKVSREHVRDRVAVQTTSERLGAVEKRIDQLEAERRGS